MDFSERINSLYNINHDEFNKVFSVLEDDHDYYLNDTDNVPCRDTSVTPNYETRPNENTSRHEFNKYLTDAIDSSTDRLVRTHFNDYLTEEERDTFKPKGFTANDFEAERENSKYKKVNTIEEKSTPILHLNRNNFSNYEDYRRKTTDLLKEMNKRETTAALIVTRAIRRWYHRVRFAKIKKQLVSLSRENPIILMKRLQVYDARCFDKSMGNRCVFRLSGEKFPPVIVYKISSSVALVDLNSGSKRRGVSSSWRVFSTFEYKVRRSKFETAKGITRLDGRFFVRNKRCLKWIKEKYSID